MTPEDLIEFKKLLKIICDAPIPKPCMLVSEQMARDMGFSEKYIQELKKKAEEEDTFVRQSFLKSLPLK